MIVHSYVNVYQGNTSAPLFPGTVGFWEVSRGGSVKILAEMTLGSTQGFRGFFCFFQEYSMMIINLCIYIYITQIIFETILQYHNIYIYTDCVE